MPKKSDFMAAEEIKAILHDRDIAEQTRIVRWVSESLGLSTTPSAASERPAPRPAAATLPQSADQPLDSQPQSVNNFRSFYDARKPKNDVQFAAVAGYFYRFASPQAERKETILPKDLDEAGRLARGCGFKNPRVTLNNAVKLGYFDRAGDGAFKLNAVGENLVAMTLPGSAKGANSGRRRRPQKKVHAKKRPAAK